LIVSTQATLTRSPRLEITRGKKQTAVSTVDKMQMPARIIKHQAGNMRPVRDMQPVDKVALQVTFR
jgi:hypothetical protein